MIESAIQRISKILRGVQTYSRDSRANQLIATAVRDIIDDTLIFCSERIRNQGIKIKIDLPDPKDFCSRCRRRHSYPSSNSNISGFLYHQNESTRHRPRAQLMSKACRKSWGKSRIPKLAKPNLLCYKNPKMTKFGHSRSPIFWRAIKYELFS